MKKFEVVVVLSNCFVQKKIILSDDIYVYPLPPMKFQGEVDYMISIKDIVGFSAPDEFIEKVQSELTESQQACLLCIQNVAAESGDNAPEKVEDLVSTCCDTLSILSRNRVTPIALASRDGDKHSWVRMLPPENPRIWHATNVPSIIDSMPTLVDKARNDKKFAMLCRLFRISQETNRTDFCIFHCLQAFEIAADEYNGYLDERLRQFFSDIDLTAIAINFPKKVGIELPDGKDFIDVLVQFRNAMAHDGGITKDTVKPFAIPFIDHMSEIKKDLAETARMSLVALASGGIESLAIKITGPAEFVIKFD